MLAGFGVVFHVAAFALESVFFMRPAVYGRFGATQETAETLRLLFFNQGFYNLFLALGGALGLAIASRRPAIGRTLVAFSCACMAGAGLVLACSAPDKLAAAFLQGGPPLLALAIGAKVWREDPAGAGAAAGGEASS